MSGQFKAILNRVGLGAVIVGIIGILVGGGDTSAAIETAGQVVTIGGAVIVFVRELFA